MSQSDLKSTPANGGNKSSPASLEQRVQALESLVSAGEAILNAVDDEKLCQVIDEVVQDRFNTDSIQIIINAREHNKDESDECRLNEDENEEEDSLFHTIFGSIKGVSAEVNVQDMSVFDAITNKASFSLTALPGDLGDSKNVELCVPFAAGSRVIGFMLMGKKGDGEDYSSDDIKFLSTISRHVAASINTSLLYQSHKKEKEQLNKTLRCLSISHSIGNAMTKISDLKNLLQYILRQAIGIMKAEKGSIMLYDPNTDCLTVRVLEGMKDQEFQARVNSNEVSCRTFRPGEGVAGKVFLTGDMIIMNSTDESSDFVESDVSFAKSILCIPMKVYNDVIGVINVTNKQDGVSFSIEDVEVLAAVADQAAVAINKAQLWEMAVTDSLTGLYIRRYFMAALQNEYFRASRYDKIFSLVMADLDSFKAINDTYGHGAGDNVLKLVSKVFQKGLRDIDIVARYGGEEFIMLLPETGSEEATVSAERLRVAVSELEIDGLPQITVSMGLVSYPEDGAHISDLIEKADAAMYYVKQSGKNRVAMYSECNDGNFPVKARYSITKDPMIILPGDMTVQYDDLNNSK